MDQPETARDGRSPSSGARPAEVPSYRIGLDVRHVRRRELGFDPAGEQRVSYTLPLAGPVDDRWRRAFRLVQLEETGYFRFRLEMGSASISFTCPQRRAAFEMGDAVRQLTVLLERVNRAASGNA